MTLPRELDLQPCQPRPWRHSLTAADGTGHHIPDLIARDFTADAPGRKLVGDITYIPTWQGGPRRMGRRDRQSPAPPSPSGTTQPDEA